MNIFLIIMFFIMGTFFGSFFTLAVYRIPLKKDITHERSFCPNCNHRLELFDLIPVWSYIFLGGRCRYCGEKIRIRYLILEILSGLVFVISYFSLNMNFLTLNLSKFIYFISFIFVYVTCVLVAGIDKENRKINSSILLFGEIMQTMYIVYLYILSDFSTYRYIMYAVIFIALFIILKKIGKEKQNYYLELMLFFAYILYIADFYSILPIVILSIIFTAILHIISKEKYSSLKNMPIGFVIGFSTICYIIVNNFITYWAM